ncbi:unnamed protein product [Symbiodinium natans]|uniref:Uncharacterized protein n=1 Tax=Symbiodinium natans TaxID=878477 RepID=A0A812GG83_9DINO|nr:unnamed protein product [Symbiodinium natans]
MILDLKEDNAWDKQYQGAIPGPLENRKSQKPATLSESKWGFALGSALCAIGMSTFFARDASTWESQKADRL